MLSSSEIRSGFLKFFEERGHTVVPSASVIPYDDPTLLFANAGMNQFKDVFLGTGKRQYVRAADSQKCVRVSGKHNDLEEVGRDTYHHTFFEMLGNWSFGDYYKKEAIAWAWELLTRVWGLEKKRLFATVFESDDEAFGLWTSVTDIDPHHVLRFGKKDNFWEMGETGPCGPCSEIHIDLTDDYSGGALVNAGDPRVMEIWNLVFIQYDRDQKGNLKPLPAKHVDTGMGFERICAVLQGKKSNYETDVFTPILSRIAAVTGKSSEGRDSEIDVAFRVIADHVRMLTFAIADGGIPSNEGRGYVMRRILRRAARFGRTLGMHDPFLYRIVDSVVASMGHQFPEIGEKREHIERVIKGEEEGFNATLDRGLEIFERSIQEIGHSKTFPGEDAFRLYDTFGFPLDLTEMMARERGLSVDTGRFGELMEEQRQRSRGVAKATLPDYPLEDLEHIRSVLPKSEFRYDISETAVKSWEEIKFLRLRHSERAMVDCFILERPTPFYAESGGQVGDTGVIRIVEEVFPILDTQKQAEFIAHYVSDRDWHRIREVLNRSNFEAPARVIIDEARRMNIERNHSATHIVHEALRRVLGSHLHQQGSLVAPDRLRFDFNHFEKITPDQLKKIEDIVNEKIAEKISVLALNDPKEWLTIEEAKRRYPNVKMFFGDKYGDRVRIVEIDPKFSVELCGGTHVGNTREIGLFKIVSEAGIASGIRRIDAVTGDGLRKYIDEQVKRIGEMDGRIEDLLREEEELQRQLGASPLRHSRPSALPVPAEPTRESLGEIGKAIGERETVIEEVGKSIADARKELSKRRVSDASSGMEEIVANAMKLDGFRVAWAKVEAGTMDELKSLGDVLRSRLSSGVGVLGSVIGEKVGLVCVVTDDLIKEKRLRAGAIVGELAKRVGGGGGGRDHLATAGGKDISKLDETLAQSASIVEALLKLH